MTKLEPTLNKSNQVWLTMEKKFMHLKKYRKRGAVVHAYIGQVVQLKCPCC